MCVLREPIRTENYYKITKTMYVLFVCMFMRVSVCVLSIIISYVKQIVRLVITLYLAMITLTLQTSLLQIFCGFDLQLVGLLKFPHA